MIILTLNNLIQNLIFRLPQFLSSLLNDAGISGDTETRDSLFLIAVKPDVLLTSMGIFTTIILIMIKI